MAGGLMVALDMDSADEAVALAGDIGERVAALKVGSQLFSRHGPEVVRRVREAGGDVFLDLKYHDIPNTVNRAVRNAVDLGVSWLTIHASGGRAMVEAAKEAAGEARVLAVTVLTSLTGTDLAELGCGGQVRDQVIRLARLARDSGADGIVCSPLEVADLRSALDSDCVLVTPGIRPAGAAADDQARTATPAGAVRAGADCIVVGRPIVNAENRRLMVDSILEEMRTSLLNT